MSRAYNYRPRHDWAQLAARIVKLTKDDPELPPAAIAERLDCSRVTVVKVQKKAGVYVPRVAHGRVA